MGARRREVDVSLVLSGVENVIFLFTEERSLGVGWNGGVWVGGVDGEMGVLISLFSGLKQMSCWWARQLRRSWPEQLQ